MTPLELSTALAIILVVAVFAVLLAALRSRRGRPATDVTGSHPNERTLQDLGVAPPVTVGFDSWGRLRHVPQLDSFQLARIHPARDCRFKIAAAFGLMLCLIHGVLLLALEDSTASTVASAMAGREALFAWLVTAGSVVGYVGMMWHRERILNLIFDALPLISNMVPPKHRKELKTAAARVHFARYRKLMATIDGRWLGIAIGIALLIAWYTNSLQPERHWMPWYCSLLLAPCYLYLAAVLGHGIVYMYASARYVLSAVDDYRQGRIRIYLPDHGREIAGLCDVHLTGSLISCLVYAAFLAGIARLGWSVWPVDIAILTLGLAVTLYFVVPWLVLRSLRARYREERVRHRSELSTATRADDESAADRRDSLQHAIEMEVDPIRLEVAIPLVVSILAWTGVNLNILKPFG